VAVAAHILILILTAQANAKPALPWILSYECDSAWGELTEQVCGGNPFMLRKAEFPSQQQAIDWIEQNYMFSPSTLTHGKEFLICESAYIDQYNEDIFRAHHKEVECRPPGTPRVTLAEDWTD
jgi:hypothetical protein